VNKANLAESKMAGKEKSKKYLCLVCNEALKRNETSVQCCVCEEYTHPACSEISPDLLKYLTEESKIGNAISWTCNHCNKVAKVLNNKIKFMYKEFSEIKKEFVDMKKQYTDLNNKVEECVGKTDSIKKDCEKAVTNSQTEVFAELRERDERKKNVIVYGIPEAAAEIKGKARKDYDVEQVCDIAREINVNLNANDIKFAKRLGEKGEESRPIQVGLLIDNKKVEILRNGKKLKDSDSYYEVYISPDLTRKQREEERELWSEAQRKNESMETDQALNYEWKVVGMKGEKRLVLAPKISSQQRGVTRGRGRGMRRGIGVQRGRASARSRGRGGRPPAWTESAGRDRQTDRDNMEEEETVTEQEED